MRGTIADMVKAGLVSQLCRHHNEVAGPDGPWDKTIEFAMREYRDLDSVTIGKLIEHCKKACRAAVEYNRIKIRDMPMECHIPTLEGQ